MYFISIHVQLIAPRLVEMVEHVPNLTHVLVHMDGQGTTVEQVSFPPMVIQHFLYSAFT